MKGGFVGTHTKSSHRSCLADLAFVLGCVLVAQRAQVVAKCEQAAVGGAVFMELAPLGGLSVGRLLRFPLGGGFTVGIGFAVHNVALAWAAAMTLLNRFEYAVLPVYTYLPKRRCC